ncbi:YceI family protein [Sphingomonas sp. TZW2008]|uniref:YceI family protein n=1 Tax=Sphingomonas sp. TZW2008 TaxID=1917973 RepID=UPI000A2700D5|nr:YceI family protein [Sphingomonas sp. TZW2008]
MRFAPVLLLSTLLTAAVVAQQPPMQAPGSKNPAAISGGTYTADAGHTLVEWTVDHLGFTPYFGLFGNITGTLTLDPKNLAAAKVDVSIPVVEVTTASAGLTKHLLKPADAGKSADFFGAAPAPARFVSTRVTPSGQTAKIAGNLTLNGVTRPVTLDAAFYGAGKMPAQMGGKENVGFTATTSIRRSEFNVGYGIPMVSDEVKLKITAAFQK